MKTKIKPENIDRVKDFLCLGFGGFFYTFIGWNWNMPLAAWIAPIFLIRFFRTRDKWLKTIPAVLLMVLASWFKFRGTMEGMLVASIEALIAPLLAMPVLIPLYLDRALFKKVPNILSFLIYPSAVTAMDFAFGNLPSLGSSGALAVTQFPILPVLQISSITGIWGVSFIISLAAVAVNAWFDNPSPERRKTAAVCLSVIALIAVAGSLRLAIFPANDSNYNDAGTVKIAGIAEEEDGFFFDILGNGTPESGAAYFKPLFKKMEDNLMRKSRTAADGGAKIIFWAEGNLFLYQDQLETFLDKASVFAKENQIYFAPSIQVLAYGSTINDNRNVMITPEGEIVYQYNKHISMYETPSDGEIKYIDTPYGRIGSAICFDMDDPAYIKQAGRKKIDILIVPAFDNQGMDPYHTHTGLLRSIENGMSVFRMVNEGTSIAVDYQGNIRAYQDYFNSTDNILYADLPTKGVSTLYSVLGDWFAYLSILVLLLVILYRAIKPIS